MSRQRKESLKPFLSVIILLMTLLATVFFKMEVRRKGYSVLREFRSYKSLKDQVRLETIQYAKLVAPSRLNKVAVHKLTLQEPEYGQVIRISDDRVALKQ